MWRAVCGDDKGESRVDGLVEGRAEGRQEMLIRLLMTRFSSLPEQILNTIEQTDDIAQLDSWFNQALMAESLDEVLF